MSYFFRLGSIYSFHYSHFVNNPKIIAFIFWGNPMSPKVHALNLSAVELTSVDRARLVHIIAKLVKIKQSSKYSGVLLYRLFLTYARQQVKKCYRTYHHQFISNPALVNYGLNEKETFTEDELRIFNPATRYHAMSDFLVKFLNYYTHRGVELENTKSLFASFQTRLTGLFKTKEEKDTTITGKPIIDKEPEIKELEQPEVKEPEEIVTENPETPKEPEEGPGGYY